MKRQTSCKSCVWALYENNTQTSCQMSMLDKFKDAGISIVEAYDNDENKNEFYVIDGICMFGRGKRWLEKNGQGKSVREIWAIIRREITLSIEVVVYVSKTASFSDIVQTVNSLYWQTLHPTSLIFVHHPPCKIKPHEYRNYFIGRPSENGNKPIPYYMEFPLEIDASEGGYPKMVDRNRCVDIAVKKCRTQNIVVVNAGYVLPPHYLAKIDSIINDNLKDILVVKPVDGENGLFLRKALHELIGGSREKPFLQKVTDTIEGDEESKKFVVEGANL